MTYRILLFFVLTVSLSAKETELSIDSKTGDWYKPIFMKHSISYLHGANYKFGERDRSILTLEHFSVWEWGEVFSFVDYTVLDHGEEAAYYEIKPKFSLSYLSDTKLELGIVKDVFIATEFNHSSIKTTEVYLAGIGFKLEVPYFQWLNVNFLWRDDLKIKGDSTYQISADWGIPIYFTEKFHMRVDGFIDIAGREGFSHSSILVVPQITVDIGNFFGQPDRLFAGVEYSYWNNKFGVDDVDEEVWQFLVKFYF